MDRLLADTSVPAGVLIARMVDPMMTAAMAETALWATLALHRGFFGYARQQLQGRWLQHPQRRVGAVPVLVLGLGQMGRAVAQRLQQNNPRLPADKAHWLAGQWAAPTPDGQWQLLADPAHKRINPVPYRGADAIATWQRISAPLLWVQALGSRMDSHWGGRYSQAEFQQRLAHVPEVRQLQLADAGHMLHHDQPEALAAALIDFLR